MIPHLFIALSLLALPLTALAEPPTDLKWEQLPDMPSGVLAASVARVGDKAVIIGGIHQLGSALHKAQVFDLKERKWLMPVDLVTGRAMHASVALDQHRILVVGGQTGTVAPLGKGLEAVASCEIIDMRTGRSTAIDPLPRPVGEPTAHRLPDGRAIVIGGESALIFDPKTNKWGKAIGLREDRSAHASAVLPDGKVIVVGGLNCAAIEVIDPAAGASKLLSAELPHTLDDTRIAVLPGKPLRVWVLGGQQSKTAYTVEQTWVIDLSDPRKSTITNGPKLGVEKGVADASVVVTGKWIVLAGGESEFGGSDTELKTARLLDPVTLAVHNLPDTQHPHDDAVMLATDEGVIIFGGFVESKLSLPIGGTTKSFRVPQAVTAVEILVLPQPK